MKVLFIGAGRTGALLKTFEKEFIKLGHKTSVFDDDDDYIKRLNSIFLTNKSRIVRRGINYLFWRQIARKTNQKILNAYSTFKPDLVLVFKGWQVSPRTLKKIKKKSKVICWMGDDPLNKRKFNDSNAWIRKSLYIYDAYFIWSEDLTSELKDLGINAYCLPVAYDEELHYPVKLTTKEERKFKAEISFIGTWDKDRNEWLSELTEFDLKIWGNSWENANKKIQKKWTRKEAIGKDFSKICAASKIMINFVRKPKVPSHNMRTFEIPACKGFQLSNRTDEVLNFFKEGEEIGCFTSKEEMKEKIKFYIQNESKRKKIIEKGYKRVRPHKYKKRVKDVIKVYNSLKK